MQKLHEIAEGNCAVKNLFVLKTEFLLESLFPADTKNSRTAAANFVKFKNGNFLKYQSKDQKREICLNNRRGVPDLVLKVYFVNYFILIFSKISLNYINYFLNI